MPFLRQQCPYQKSQGEEHLCRAVDSVFEMGLRQGKPGLGALLCQETHCVTLVLALRLLESHLCLSSPEDTLCLCPSEKGLQQGQQLHTAVTALGDLTPCTASPSSPRGSPMQVLGHLLYPEDGCQPGAETLCRKKTGGSHITPCSLNPASIFKG